MLRDRVWLRRADPRRSFGSRPSESPPPRVEVGRNAPPSPGPCPNSLHALPRRKDRQRANFFALSVDGNRLVPLDGLVLRHEASGGLASDAPHVSSCLGWLVSSRVPALLRHGVGRLCRSSSRSLHPKALLFSFSFSLSFGGATRKNATTP